MRDFEQRKAEIFRRSNARILERKCRRKKMMLSCVPLTLCVVALLTAILYFAPMHQGKNDIVFNDCSSGVVLAEVSSADGYYMQYTDQVAALNMLNAIHSIVSEDMDYSASENEYVPANDPLGYTVTFIWNDGNISVYTIAGTILIDEATGRRYVLTEGQLNSLYTILGLQKN